VTGYGPHVYLSSQKIIIKTFRQLGAFIIMMKPKRKRVTTAVKVAIPPVNDGMNTPVPDHTPPVQLPDGEADLFKQAENPLGDPHKK